MKPQRQVDDKRLMGPHNDPLATESILERFYKPVAESDRIASIAANDDDAPAPKAKDKPTHYKVVCISLYNHDIEHLEEMVSELKRRGHTKANKSQLIRAALAQVDLGKIPKGF
jgi:hypothetical protein